MLHNPTHLVMLQPTHTPKVHTFARAKFAHTQPRLKTSSHRVCIVQTARTPLHCAFINGQHATGRLLLDANADVDMRDTVSIPAGACGRGWWWGVGVAWVVGCTYMYVRIHIYICMCAYIYSRTYMYVRIHMYVYAAHICMCGYIYMRTYIYVCAALPHTAVCRTAAHTLYVYAALPHTPAHYYTLQPTSPQNILQHTAAHGYTRQHTEAHGYTRHVCVYMRA